MRVAYTKARLASRIRQLARSISKDYAGRTLDVVIVLDNGYLFGADLIRSLSVPVICHFVRAEMRDLKLAGHERREIYFSWPPKLRGRDVLLVDAILNTGVTQDFLMKQLEESRPRSIRLAVLFDKPGARKLDIKAEYTGFSSASNYWVGYGLGGRDGLYRNLPYVALSPPSRRKGAATRRRGAARGRVKSWKG
ncbi:MAG: phosphoribosyltransferase family protein [Candidatus Acidiferrales bacterium]